MEKSKSLFLSMKRLMCVVISVLMITAIFGFASVAPLKANAEEQYSEYPPTAITISNGHFNTSSSSYPASVNSWSGDYKGNLSGDVVVSGVIELTGAAYSSSADEIKLNQYEEYKNSNVPQTPFGKQKTENGNMPYFDGSSSSALMINTDNHETVYGYTSTSINLEANGFYKLGVWVKTGDFTKTSKNAGVGASVSLLGIDEKIAEKNGYDSGIAFTSINTVKDLDVLTPSNYYGWKEYIFYVATDYHSYTVSLELSVGYAYSGEYGSILEQANGYALFDTATAYSISPESFELATSQKQDNTIIIECDSSSYLTDESGNDIGSFNATQNDNHNIKGWTQVTSINGNEFSPQTNEAPFIYNPNNFFTDNNIGLKSNPATPYGLTDKGNNILMFYNTANEYKGLQSTSFTVKQYQYYKISFWTNTANIKDTDSASASLVYINPNDPENEVINTISDIKGNSENKKNYGWVYNAFFIKGSSARDYQIALQLWFGRDKTPAKGIAMFDDVKIENIDYDTYSDYGADFTTVDLTADYSDDSGVSNGNFLSAENPDSDEYPLIPSNWASSSEKSDDLIAGLLPKDKKDIWTNFDIPYPFADLLPSLNYGNALVISSTKPTAYSYTSSDISISTETTTLITVRAKTVNCANAYITVKNNGAVIATIPSLSSEKGFTDYKIYLKNGTDSHSVTVEISFGSAAIKSSGTLIIEKIKSETLEEIDYDDLKQKSFSNSDMAIYDFDDIFACDTSKYANDSLMTSYHWNYTKGSHEKASDNVKYGILYLKDSRKGYLPSDFNKGLAPKDYIFYAQNTAPNASVFTYNKSISLLANTYYEIKVSAKVEIPSWYLEENPKAVGLGIRLDNTDYAFSNIIQSRTAESDTSFKTYSFYIAVGAEDASSTMLSFTFGGSENIEQFVQGKFYINNISISDITESAYNNAVNDLVEYNVENANKDEFGIKIDYAGNTDDETETEPSDDENNIVDENLNQPENLYWYILPSVLFGVFLLLALVAVVIRKFTDKVENRKHKEKANSYDRDYTLHIDVDNQNNTEPKKTESSIDRYESFDENAPSSELKKPQEETTAVINKEPISTAEEQPIPAEEQPATEENPVPTEAPITEEKVEEKTEEKEDTHEDFND